MKQKIFMLLALVMTVMTASAKSVTYALSVDQNAHGTIAFTNATGDEITSAAEGQTVTVTIKPDEGWYGEPVGEWYAAIAAARNRTSSTTDIEMLKDITFASAGTNTWTFIMQRANAEVGATYKKLLTHADISIEEIAPMTYTGQPVIPTVVVKDGTTPLDEGTDYTLSYSNNINAGNAADGDAAPTVIITAVSTSEKYAGSVNAYFTISKTTGSIAFAEAAYEKNYGDADFTNEITVEGDGAVSFSSDNSKVASVDKKSGLVRVLRAGTAKITATLDNGNNYGGAKASFKVTVSEKVMFESNGICITRDVDGYHFVMNENVAPGIVIGSDYDEAVTMEYTRTLRTEGKTPVNLDGEQRFLFTLCTPFLPHFDAKFYTLAGVEGASLKFNEVEKPLSYRPYLVATTKDTPVTPPVYDVDITIEQPHWHIDNRAAAVGDEYTVVMKGLNLDHTIYHSAVVDGYQLKGTLRGLTNAEAAAEGAYTLQNNGSWGAVKAGNEAVYIPPFRAYIVAASQNARSLDNNFGSGTTSIERIVTVDRDGTEHWYDLQGRPIEKPATKGIYIHNGMKVVVK